jgi:hypothetical protein
MTKQELDLKIETVLKAKGRLVVRELTKVGISERVIYDVFGDISAVRAYATKRFPKLKQSTKSGGKLDSLRAELAGLLK